MRAVFVGCALVVGIGGGLAACGDDDDASDTVTGQTDESTTTSAPATTRASATTSAAPSTTARSSTTTTGQSATETSAADDEAAATGTDAASDATDAASDATTTSAAPTAQPAATETSTEGPAIAADSTAPSGSAPDGTVTGSSGPTTSAGPTTTGPECEYTENDQFPLERCDAGPAIAAVQSVLQVLEYEIGTVDCLFGDQTHYAVRAFQADKELTVDGAVGSDTWAALDIPNDWGTDTNGNGSIEPNEITLTCA